MYRSCVRRNDKTVCFGARAAAGLWALLLCAAIGALAQSSAPASKGNSQISIQATHLLGLQNTKNNCKGILSVENNVLGFQQSGKPIVEVNISSIRNIFLGEENQQVGGTPMTIGKAAAPFGGGRVVSLFAHTKYDTLTLEYVDNAGAIHGAIFQLRKGQGELVRNQVVSRGVYSGSGEDQLKKSASEVTHENK